MAGTGKVELKVKDGIATITLNRPEVLNALNADMWRGLEDAAVAIAHNTEVRVAILHGAGDRAFSAGLDLKAAARGEGFPARDVRAGADSLTAVKHYITIYQELAVPVIAAIHGYCMGGACQLAVACDIRIASDDAILAIPEAKVLGIVPDLGGTQRLPRLVGPGYAKIMLMTGRRVNAQEALRVGLVDEVHPKGEHMAAAMALAEEIASINPDAVQGVKRSVDTAMSTSLGVGLAFETATALSLPRMGDVFLKGAETFSKRSGKGSA